MIRNIIGKLNIFPCQRTLTLFLPELDCTEVHSTSLWKKGWTGDYRELVWLIDFSCLARSDHRVTERTAIQNSLLHPGFQGEYIPWERKWKSLIQGDLLKDRGTILNHLIEDFLPVRFSVYINVKDDIVGLSNKTGDQTVRTALSMSFRYSFIFLTAQGIRSMCKSHTDKNPIQRCASQNQ